MVLADSIVRYQKLMDKEVFFNTGTDEHGVKIFRKAQEEGKEVKQYVDEFAEKFKNLMPALGVLPEIHFIRTTDEHHIKACQAFWERCFKNEDIYKKIYHIKYCVGCELEKTESELTQDGKCLVHPNLAIEVLEEENYFFRFSKYQKPLLDLYEKYPDFVVPEFRFNEIKEFVKKGLQDFSISRLKAKMPWGVPVPGDETQVMYVWFDALINYVSTLGWDAPSNQQTGKSANQFTDFWGTEENPKAVQIAGKDNLRQQSAMWQAMLLSAGLPTTRQIIIHGFITSGGQKMSKSLGNVADPYSIINQLKEKGLTVEQAIDALRYYLLREIPTFEDGDYTWERLVESYNANLANGVGNLTSRILKMAVNAGIMKYELGIRNEKINQHLEKYELQKAMDLIWQKIKACDEYIQKTEPFKKIKINEAEAKKDIEFLLLELHQIGLSLLPFLPHTAEQILSHLNLLNSESSAEALAKADKALTGNTQNEIPRLFPRI
jgi:methionyl-tRNA synthetase